MLCFFLFFPGPAEEDERGTGRREERERAAREEAFREIRGRLLANPSVNHCEVFMAADYISGCQPCLMSKPPPQARDRRPGGDGRRVDARAERRGEGGRDWDGCTSKTISLAVCLFVVGDSCELLISKA